MTRTKPPRRRAGPWLAAGLLLAIAAASCGQKGPLYLPEEQADSQAPDRAGGPSAAEPRILRESAQPASRPATPAPGGALR